MLNSSVVFTAPWIVDFVEQPISDKDLQPHEIFVEKVYSLISPGTELACLSGKESWFTMPSTPGYSSVSKIIKACDQHSSLQEGDYVFHYGNHAKYEKIQPHTPIIKIPSDIPLTWIPFARIVSIAMTAMRVSNIELGDYVAITGLGVVGQFVAQLAQLQGAQVIGIDMLASRRKIADTCHIFHTIDGNDHNILEKIMQLTHNNGVSTYIDASGSPQAVASSLPYVAPYGEVILLGSPRGEHQVNLTEILNYCHLIDYGCLTFKGAHEWRIPVEATHSVKHSIVRNTHIAFSLMQSKKLTIEPLISHILSPYEHAKTAYSGLSNDKENYFGVLFDWTQSEHTVEDYHLSIKASSEIK